MESKSSGSPATFIDNLVVPGDVVVDLSSMTNQTIKLGGGLRQDCDAISVMKAGKLRFSKPNKYWVENSQKRYVPCAEDSVLGIVVDSKSDNFLIDIKGPALAFLPVLAFEGGTRRNIPKFEAGTLLYVRVVKANPGMNPELSCTDASGKAAEFGALKDGYMFECSTGLSRMLLSSPTCPVLEALGKKLSFEIAVGLNGRVWVNANSPSIVIIVANAIMNSETLSGPQVDNPSFYRVLWLVWLLGSEGLTLGSIPSEMQSGPLHCSCYRESDTSRTTPYDGKIETESLLIHPNGQNSLPGQSGVGSEKHEFQAHRLAPLLMNKFTGQYKNTQMESTILHVKPSFNGFVLRLHVDFLTCTVKGMRFVNNLDLKSFTMYSS
ncbi:hypothetical protein NC652_029684 [Populus alba x Populus x berolinensis]|nr:hypothetical protein NC652_029684 [Populus alba x Populus x berolinensis]